jgi:hypothetical protein
MSYDDIFDFNEDDVLVLEIRKGLIRNPNLRLVDTKSRDPHIWKRWRRIQLRHRPVRLGRFVAGIKTYAKAVPPSAIQKRLARALAEYTSQLPIGGNTRSAKTAPPHAKPKRAGATLHRCIVQAKTSKKSKGPNAVCPAILASNPADIASQPLATATMAQSTGRTSR